MKQPKKPTRTQKELIKAAGLDWKNWNVAAEDNEKLVAINKRTGSRRTIRKV